MTPAHLIPLTPGFPPRQRSAAALSALAREIPEHDRPYISSDRRLGVLSLPAIAVWTNGRVFWWQDRLGDTAWSAADAPGAARRMLHWSGPRWAPAAWRADTLRCSSAAGPSAPRVVRACQPGP